MIEDDQSTDAAFVAQFGALCMRQNGLGGTEILLITKRETKRWTIPKGWPIKGLKPHQVAEREAWEEAGVEGRAKRRAFGRFTYDKKLDDGTVVPATVEVHLLNVKRPRRRFPERTDRNLVWLTPGEAAKLVAEPELQRMIGRLEARI